MIVLAGFLTAPLVMQAQGADRIPQRVMEALKAKFPSAEIRTWAREREEDFVVYDIEFRQGVQKFEADIKEDGTIRNWERQISITDLPGAVRKAVDTKYPKGVLKEIMAITAVKDGKDTPEGYEIVIETAGKKEVEITLAPNGKLMEDSGKQE